jgi:hypothetical protein
MYLFEKSRYKIKKKVPFVVAYFQVSATPRPEISDADEKDALFGLDTQITILETLPEKAYG